MVNLRCIIELENVEIKQVIQYHHFAACGRDVNMLLINITFLIFSALFL